MHVADGLFDPKDHQHCVLGMEILTEFGILLPSRLFEPRNSMTLKDSASIALRGQNEDPICPCDRFTQ